MIKDKQALEGGRISILGARVHNLKNIDVEIPRNKLTVITGMSGSGKSSLAFDTIFAEGQRRYVETFSAYARNFLGNMERPDVDKITGLSRLSPLSKRQPIRILVPPSVRLPRSMTFSVCFTLGGRGLFLFERGEDGEIYRGSSLTADLG